MSHFCSSGIIRNDNFDLGAEAPLVLNCKVDVIIDATCMVDSGASSQFIDYDFAVSHGLTLIKKQVPESLTVVDGRPSAGGLLTHEVHLQLLIDQHLENLTFQVTQLAAYPLILGKSWLRRHNPTVNWIKNSVVFGSGFCHAHCLPVRPPAPVHAVPSVPMVKSHRIALISAAGFHIAAREKGAHLFVASLQPDGSLDPDDSAWKLVPERYHDYLHLFTKKEADVLPKHRYIDHAIPLEDGF